MGREADIEGRVTGAAPGAPTRAAGVAERALYERALGAAAQAYAPYSGLQVGAALTTASGAVFTGVNVENASYPVGLCAERAALAAAVTSGERRFAALAVATAAGTPVLPCGACLQALAEFGDLDLVLAWPGDAGAGQAAPGGAAPGDAAPAAGAGPAPPAPELRVLALRDLLTAPFALPGAP